MLGSKVRVKLGGRAEDLPKGFASPPQPPAHLGRVVCRLAPQLPWTSGHLISQEERGKIYMQTREVSCGFSSGKQACATSKQHRTSAAACHTSPCISEHS